MAPAQITGTDVDHRTDLYAIGCTLFELVCGRPPFVDGDILYAQMHTPPQSLIAKSADDRPGSANEVRAVFGTLRG